MPDRAGINAPARSNRFEVELELGGSPIPNWHRVDLPSSTSTKAQYREGTDPEYDFPLWGQTEHSDLVMERGAKSGETLLWDWRKKVTDGKLDEARKNIAVKIMDEGGSQTLLRYEFQDAWPVEYQAPTLDAQAGSGLATETLVVTYDTYDRTQ
jgi:phage tail-like protein